MTKGLFCYFDFVLFKYIKYSMTWNVKTIWRYRDKTEFQLYLLQFLFFAPTHINNNVFRFLYILLIIVFANLTMYVCAFLFLFLSGTNISIQYMLVYILFSNLSCRSPYSCTYRFLPLSVTHFQSSPFCENSHCYIVCWKASLLIGSWFVANVLLFQIMMQRIFFFVCCFYLWTIFPYFQEVLLIMLP